MFQAITVRDSMAKSLYSALFDWIVFRINHALLNAKDLEESTKVTTSQRVCVCRAREAGGSILSWGSGIVSWAAGARKHFLTGDKFYHPLKALVSWKTNKQTGSQAYCFLSELLRRQSSLSGFREL